MDTSSDRDAINLDDCRMTEEEAKTKIQKTKFVYSCPICNKILSQRGKLRDHLSSKYLCSQRVTIDYLRKSIKDNQTVSTMTDQLDEMIHKFFFISERASDVQHVKQCKNLLRQYRYRTIVCDVRIIALHDYSDVHRFDDELAKYDKIISEIQKKYLLLLF